MKRILMILVVLTLVLTGCGPKDKTIANDSTNCPAAQGIMYEDLMDEALNNCYITVTDGFMPKAQFEDQLNGKDIRPIKYYDLKTDDVSKAESNNWNYWLVCKKW